VQQSEQAMAWTLIEAAADFTIWIGDRNFGIWSMGHKPSAAIRIRSRA